MTHAFRKHFSGLIALALLVLAQPLHANDDELEQEALEAASMRAELQQYLTTDTEGRQVAAFMQQQFAAEIPAYVKGMSQRDPFAADELAGHLREIYHEYTELHEDVPEEAALFLQIQRHEVLSHILSESFDPDSPNAAEIAQDPLGTGACV